MKGSHVFGLMVVVSMAIIISASGLLIADMIGMTAFWIMLIVSVLVMFLPMLLLKKTSIRQEHDGISIESPFMSTVLRYSEIESLSTMTELDVGFRTWGFQTLGYCSGDFSNSSLGAYKAALHTKVPLFIVVRTMDRRILVFNLPSVEETKALYDSMRSRVRGDAVAPAIVMTPEERSKAKRAKRIIVAIVAVCIAATVIFVGWSMTAGSVEAELTDDRLEIRATMMKENVYYEDIVSVELRDDVSYGIRVGGLGNSKVLTGNFENDEFDRYRLAVYRSTDMCVVIHKTSGTVVFNLADDDRTRAVFEELQNKVGAQNPGTVSATGLHACF